MLWFAFIFISTSFSEPLPLNPGKTVEFEAAPAPPNLEIKNRPQSILTEAGTKGGSKASGLVSTKNLITAGVAIDGFNFNNPDGLTIDVVNQNNVALYHSTSAMNSFGWTPQTDHVTVTAKKGNAEVFRKDFRTSLGNGPRCYYSLLVSETEGYTHEMSSLSSRGCTADEDNYHPNTGVPKYAFDNESDHPFYPAFRKDGAEFASDSIHRWVQPGEIRIYTPEDAYWSSPVVDIHEGDQIAVAVFDPYVGNFLVCDNYHPAIGEKTFVLSKVDGEYICRLKADHQSACSNAWKADTLYNKGDKASNAGKLWEAKFTSYGFPPTDWLWTEIGSSSC